MPQTFRHKPLLKYQGMLFSVIFLVVVIVHTSLFFIEDPANHGFNGKFSPAMLGSVCVALYGTMFLGSLFLWADASRNELTLTDTTLTHRSLFRTRSLELANIQKLKWSGTSFQLYTPTQSVKIHLSNYPSNDQLTLIKTFRSLVLPDHQEGWPLFCHHIALPLRDGQPAVTRTDIPVTVTQITRKRYDYALLWSTPLALLVAIPIWYWLNLWQPLIVLPLTAIATCLLFRYTTPKEGKETIDFKSKRIFLPFLLIACWTILALFATSFLPHLGVTKSTAEIITIILILPGFPVMFYYAYQSDKHHHTAHKKAATSAPELWDDLK